MDAGIRVRGHIKVTVTRDDGSSYVHYDGHNLIVDGGLTGLANLITQTTTVPADYGITLLRAGESNTAPAAGQTALQGAQVGPDKTFTVVTIDSGGTAGLVDYETSLGTTEGNGQTIQEVGLFFNNGNMFSRQVIGSIAKTSSITVTFNWRVQFSR